MATAGVDVDSAAYINEINSAGNTLLHPDFGGNGAYGIPFVVVPQTQKLKSVKFVEYPDESDLFAPGDGPTVSPFGLYPIPKTAPVEGGGVGDSHVLALRQGDCRLFELYHAKWKQEKKRWNAGSGAIFNLMAPLQGQRPAGWTSADAAGLPILPGLVRYDEVAAGAVNHAIRVTFDRSTAAYLDPATHCAGNSGHDYAAPEGMRLRLRSSYTQPGLHGQALVIVTAMKKYGLIMADNGTNWFITGAADPRWDDEDLNQLKNVPGDQFDVVDASGSSIAASQHICHP